MMISALRFLVVEDQGFQRWATGNALTTLGAQHVLCASDGQEALDIVKAAEDPLDIIVSDLNMPGMDGMEFIRHVAEAGTQVSFILTSALDRALLDSVQAMTTAYGVNVLGAIEKPVTAKKLKEVIELHTPVQRPAALAAVKPHFTVEEIRDGLANDEFEPFFQPKVDMATRKLKGAEALARWRHGSVIATPAAFLAQIEEAGLADELMWAMLRKASHCCRLCREANIDASVSVNLSLRSLDDMRLADRITRMVAEEQLDPRDVILEVTESAEAIPSGRALENLTRLRMRGFGLSIDDCGTGYSSLQRLTHIPFTELKIDQSFVRSAPSRNSSLQMLESTLEIARRLKLTAVAEGIETEAEWALIRDLRCQLAQGYYIARPMDAASYIEWGKAWSRQH